MLTNEANFVLHHFFKIYKDRLDDGESEETARWFMNGQKVHHDYFLGFNFESFLAYTRELSTNKYVTLGRGDNGFSELILNPKAIIEFQNLYNNNTKKLFNALIDLKKIISI